MSGTRCILLLISILIFACSESAPIPKHDIFLQIIAGNDEVEPGTAFPLTVIRVWKNDLTPEEWSDKTLDPLVVKLLEKSRRSDGDRTEETLSFLCYAFSLEDIVIAGPVFKAKSADKGLESSVTGNELLIRVEPVLDPLNPGDVELPGDILEKPFAWLFWSAIGAVAIAAFSLVIWRMRRKQTPSVISHFEAEPTKQPPPEPDIKALMRLKKLRMLDPKSEEETQTYYMEASALMGEYTSEQFSMGAKKLTSEERIDALYLAGAVEAGSQVDLKIYLSSCDNVKFGCYSSTGHDRDNLLDTGEKFLKETRSAIRSDFGSSEIQGEGEEK